MREAGLLVAAVVALLAGCGRGEPSGDTRLGTAPQTQGVSKVTAERLVAADQDTANWLTHGRTYDEQRFSPLDQINDQNVAGLKLDWYFDLPTDTRAQEATPLIVDGVMYVTSAWSKVFALDARTGKEIWSYDPKVPREWIINACCDAVNRGVALSNGRIYVGTLDGRLVALDAETGKPVWETLTVDRSMRYSITGAPRVVKGKVIIGNGGAELGVRGYVTAYDEETGKQVWRFYTVPGEPGKKDGAASDEVLEKLARPTWTGQWWKEGGGGTVWDAMAFDPELDLLYIGVGNGAPWNHAIRSPDGGDNLFLTSIVALRPDTGEYVWHYQTTPGETWDYTATQHMILADLQINGQTRKVIMQAPKNGFFYVLDRATGELLSAERIAEVTWAKGIDLKTGRPIENPEARFGNTGKPWTGTPGPMGAHSWQPMSFSPQTKLVYIPVNEAAFTYIHDTSYAPRQRAFNTGTDFGAGALPEDQAIVDQIKQAISGRLSAWDPVAQKEVWRVEYDHPWNGGVLSTAGNLVFQGNSMGQFAAFRATTGERLWSFDAQAGILAAPITYSVDGDQFVAIEVGWGGAFAMSAGELARDTQPQRGNLPRVLVFSLKGNDTLPPPPSIPERVLQPPAATASAKEVAQGKAFYHRHCSTCHGDSAVSGGVLPDLRYSAALADAKLWKSIVHDGALEARGMVSFAPDLNAQEIDTIRAYVIHRAHQTMASENKSQTGTN